MNQHTTQLKFSEEKSFFLDFLLINPMRQKKTNIGICWNNHRFFAI